MWEVSSLPGVFVENWPKFGHQVEYLLKTDRNTKRLSSVAVEAQFSNSSQGWLEIRIQSNSGRENIIRNDFISTMVVDFRKDLHFYFHRLHIFKRPAWVTSVSRLVRMTDNCWDMSMCCQCAANVLPMYLGPGVSIFQRIGSTFVSPVQCHHVFQVDFPSISLTVMILARKQNQKIKIKWTRVKFSSGSKIRRQKISCWRSPLIRNTGLLLEHRLRRRKRVMHFWDGFVYGLVYALFGWFCCGKTDEELP